MLIEREKTGVDEANTDFLTGILGDTDLAEVSSCGFWLLDKKDTSVPDPEKRRANSSHLFFSDARSLRSRRRGGCCPWCEARLVSSAVASQNRETTASPSE